MSKKAVASEQNVHIEFTVICTRSVIRKIIDRIISVLDKFGIQTTITHQENTEPTEPISEDINTEE